MLRGRALGQGSSGTASLLILAGLKASLDLCAFVDAYPTASERLTPKKAPEQEVIQVRLRSFSLRCDLVR
jgi:hypothetical protein